VSVQLHPSSFRDPDATVILKNGHVYRLIFNSYCHQFEQLVNSGLYEELVLGKMLVSHTEVDAALVNLPLSPNLFKIIKPERIPFISYPYEWSFFQLKRAAVLTLEIQLKALQKGMSLKDATAYNVQFNGSEPVFIDTSSFEIYSEGSPWQAYGQFCRHFLGPLLLWSYGKKEMLRLASSFIDGIPLKVISYSLPAKTKYSFFILSHIHLHAKLENKHQGDTSLKNKTISLSKDRLKALIEHVKNGIEKLHPLKESSEWTDYYETFSYDKTNYTQKQSIVRSFIEAIKPDMLLDLGCNEGEFSILCKDQAKYIVSADFDPLVITNFYAALKKHDIKNILPLVIDFTNPSPGIGLNNKERTSFIERSNYDAVLALALIHHLTIGNNIPFDSVAEILSKMTANLVIEFVPKEDPQTQRLLITKKDIFHNYTLEEFKSSFSKHFRIIEEKQLDNSSRVLFRMQLYA